MPKKVLKAGPAALAGWQARVREAETAAAAAERAKVTTQRESAKDSLDQARDLAGGRGVEHETTTAGAVVVAHDGLDWLRRKGKIALAQHYEAGLRFRGDWECANGTGVRSGLAELSGVHGKGSSGPSDAMLCARDRVKSALAALGTPLLHRYAVGVAAEGRMLGDPMFTKDPKRGDTHLLPLVITLDLLARHYGLIR